MWQVLILDPICHIYIYSHTRNVWRNVMMQLGLAITVVLVFGLIFQTFVEGRPRLTADSSGAPRF